MLDAELAQTSNTLFNVAFLIYIAAMVAYFFRLAFTRVSVAGVPASTRAGERVGFLATGLASVGALVHLGSVVARGLAAERVPWANMYEYSSLLALGTVVVGLFVIQRRMGYGHLMGFVIALAVLSMTSALLLFTEAGPVVPALNSYWIKIHTSAAMASSSIFIVAFAVTALYLVKETAERRLAERSAESFSGSTVGAAYAGSQAPVEGDSAAYRPADFDDEGAEDEQDAVASALAQRDMLSPIAFPIVPFIVVAVFTFTVWRAPLATLIAASVAALLGTATWYAVPFLPPASKLDALAYRIIAFGFPIWTFAVLAGAIWAQEAWGRYWGWDPKETGSFFTWVLYAGYLHARSTRGWRGRRAGWIAVVAFVALMVTYYAVNLFVVGLHSYAGV
jgi:cytochrome c-type biogenesis protein CcsB